MMTAEQKRFALIAGGLVISSTLFSFRVTLLRCKAAVGALTLYLLSQASENEQDKREEQAQERNS